MQVVESRNVSYSVILHITVLLIAAFGLPALLPKTPDPEPMVMSVELLPISEISNVKPSDKPIQQAQSAPVKTKPLPTPKPPTPTPPTPKTQATPDPTPPPKPAEKTFDPDEGAEKPDKIKPIEKEKPKEAEKPKQDDFEKIMKQLQQQEKTEAKPTAATPTPNAPVGKTNQEENKTKSDKPYDDSAPLSISEKDMIRSQFIPCWNMPAGAKDANTLAALIDVKLQPDGTVISAELDPSQSGRYASDSYFKAAADSAMRAVHKCSPLKNLPPEKYSSWQEMKINFNPKDL